MIKFLGALVGAMALSFASAASSAIVVPTIEGMTQSNGIAKIRTENAALPLLDGKAFMLFTWNFGELDDLAIDQQLVVTQGVIDPFAPGGVRYASSYLTVPLCTFKNGCVELVGEREALARITVPEWDLPCDTAAGTVCFQKVNIDFTYSEIFVRATPGRIISGTLTLYEGSPVPEPATWAMMITGFGLAGAALRRRRAAYA